MEATDSPEMLVLIYQITRQHTPKDHNLENLGYPLHYGLLRPLVYYLAMLFQLQELYSRRLSAKLVPNLADKECRMVSATNPHGR
jgi:hypothetical protein